LLIAEGGLIVLIWVPLALLLIPLILVRWWLTPLTRLILLTPLRLRWLLVPLWLLVIALLVALLVALLMALLMACVGILPARLLTEVTNTTRTSTGGSVGPRLSL